MRRLFLLAMCGVILLCPRITLAEGAQASERILGARMLLAQQQTQSPAQTPPPAQGTSNATPPTSPTITQVVPQLSVPIPGVQFTTPTLVNGNVEVPFLAQYLTGIYRYALAIVTILAIIMVIYGGFHYLLGGTVGSVKTGETIIRDAVGGMAILTMAYFILYFINPNLTSLRALRLSSVQSVPLSEGSIADSLARDQESGDLSAAPGQGPRSLCRENLVPQMHRGGTRVWCSACGGCREIQTGRPDRACLALLSCGGGLGQFLDALTDDCTGKTFGWLETLDGGTFGILHYTENEVTGLLNRLQQKDPAAYARVIAAGNGVQISNEALCASNRNDRGFICNPGYRAMLEAALRERSFTLVQLAQVQERYNRIRGIAQSMGFQSAYGQAMIATMLNNPGACGGSLAPLRQRCTQSNESERIDCYLREFVAVPCRGNAVGAQSRVNSITQNLANVSRSSPPEVKSLQELEACIPN